MEQESQSAGRATRFFGERPVETLSVSHLCDFELFFRPLEMFANPLGTTRLNFIIDHGIARGPQLRGEFQSGGDWVQVGPDGVVHLDVRATLRADDDSLVFITNTGRSFLDVEARDRFFAGEVVGRDHATIWSSPSFETDSQRYGWLNGITTIAENEVAIDRVHYRVYCLGQPNGGDS